jgi:hypothetical protein
MSNRLIMPQIVTINVEKVEMMPTISFNKNKLKRSNSVDNFDNKRDKKFVSFSCSNINNRFDSLSINPKLKNSKFSVPTSLLKLPKSSGMSSNNSKLSLNCVFTPSGSIYDVSETNSMIFKNEDELCIENEQKLFTSNLKLSQLDEQIATNYKLKCKNWLQNLINSST